MSGDYLPRETETELDNLAASLRAAVRTEMERILTTEGALLDSFAAAYWRHTRLSPADAVLVRRSLPNGAMEWYFRPKTEEER